MPPGRSLALDALNVLFQRLLQYEGERLKDASLLLGLFETALPSSRVGNRQGSSSSASKLQCSLDGRFPHLDEGRIIQPKPRDCFGCCRVCTITDFNLSVQTEGKAITAAN